MWDAFGIFWLLLCGTLIAVYFFLASFGQMSFARRLALRVVTVILLYEIVISLRPLFQ